MNPSILQLVILGFFVFCSPSYTLTLQLALFCVLHSTLCTKYAFRWRMCAVAQCGNIWQVWFQHYFILGHSWLPCLVFILHHHHQHLSRHHQHHPVGCPSAVASPPALQWCWRWPMRINSNDLFTSFWFIWFYVLFSVTFTILLLLVLLLLILLMFMLLRTLLLLQLLML